jgi:regulator of replication initiation timing
MFQTFFVNSNGLYESEDIKYFVGYLRMRKELASVNPENAHLKTQLAETKSENAILSVDNRKTRKELASVQAVMGMKCFQQSVENDLLCKELDAAKKQAAATHLDNCDLFIKKRMVSKELESVKEQAADTESENVKHVVDNAKMRQKTELLAANHMTLLAEKAELTNAAADLKKQLAIAQNSLLIMGILFLALAYRR